MSVKRTIELPDWLVKEMDSEIKYLEDKIRSLHAEIDKIDREQSHLEVIKTALQAIIDGK